MTTRELHNFVTEYIEKGPFSGEVIFEEDTDVLLTFATVNYQPARDMIGPKGETLFAVNYLLRKLLEQNIKEKDQVVPHILVDVDGYHKRNIEGLKTKAKILVDRARSFKRNIELEPMNPHDRLLVHNYLSQLPDIETESIGQGPERHIVIKYKETQENDSFTL